MPTKCRSVEVVDRLFDGWVIVDRRTGSRVQSD